MQTQSQRVAARQAAHRLNALQLPGGYYLVAHVRARAAGQLLAPSRVARSPAVVFMMSPVTSALTPGFQLGFEAEQGLAHTVSVDFLTYI